MRFKLKVVERAGMRLNKPHQCLGEDNVNKVTTQHEHCVYDKDMRTRTYGLHKKESCVRQICNNCNREAINQVL